MLLLMMLAQLFALDAYGQQRIVTGRVLDNATDENMIGVSVQVKGTATGGITDMDGKFQVNVSSADAVLVFSYMGYQTEEVKVGQQSDLTIRMKEDGELLEEVVVIGYGTQKRKDVTTAISSVSTKDLDERPIVSAAQALQGKAAGRDAAFAENLCREYDVPFYLYSCPVEKIAKEKHLSTEAV